MSQDIRSFPFEIWIADKLCITKDRANPFVDLGNSIVSIANGCIDAGDGRKVGIAARVDLINF